MSNGLPRTVATPFSCPECGRGEPRHELARLVRATKSYVDRAQPGNDKVTDYVATMARMHPHYVTALAALEAAHQEMLGWVERHHSVPGVKA